MVIVVVIGVVIASDVAREEVQHHTDGPVAGKAAILKYVKLRQFNTIYSNLIWHKKFLL